MCDVYVSVDVVQVVLDVFGLVEVVKVVDNQLVKCGEVLFVVDQVCYWIVLEQVQVVFGECCVMLEQLCCEIVCDCSLVDLVVVEDVEVCCVRLQVVQVLMVIVQVVVDLVWFNLVWIEV